MPLHGRFPTLRRRLFEKQQNFRIFLPLRWLIGKIHVHNQSAQMNKAGSPYKLMQVRHIKQHLFFQRIDFIDLHCFVGTANKAQSSWPLPRHLQEKQQAVKWFFYRLRCFFR
jgi:hypothetical protein